MSKKRKKQKSIGPDLFTTLPFFLWMFILITMKLRLWFSIMDIWRLICIQLEATKHIYIFLIIILSYLFFQYPSDSSLFPAVNIYFSFWVQRRAVAYTLWNGRINALHWHICSNSSCPCTHSLPIRIFSSKHWPCLHQSIKHTNFTCWRSIRLTSLTHWRWHPF